MSAVASIIDPDVGTKRPLGPWANGMMMTPEEFDAETEWDPDFRYELINGVLIVTPPPDIGERVPNDELGYLLRDYRYHHPNGSVIDETVGEQTVTTAKGRRRMDRAIWIGFGRAIDPDRDIPTIAIEFVSDSSRDRRRDYVQKRQEFELLGIREYWIIDRFRRSMTVIRQGDVQVLAEADTYKCDLLPGLELPLARLLAIADRFPKKT